MKERYGNSGLTNIESGRHQVKGAQKTKRTGKEKREQIKMERHSKTEAGVVKRRER